MKGEIRMLLRCCCLCKDDLEQVLQEGGRAFTQETNIAVELTFFTDPIVLYSRLGNGLDWDAVLVALSGALGMEAATRIREEYPNKPLIWCSDDRLFGIHSYRLHCAMFLLFPVTAEQIAVALTRCVEGIERGGPCNE